MIPRTTAGKLEIIMQLMDTNEYDDEGNIIGQKEPIITVEEAAQLLEIELGIKDED